MSEPRPLPEVDGHAHHLLAPARAGCCLLCGEPITVHSGGRGRPRSYCSDDCRRLGAELTLGAEGLGGSRLYQIGRRLPARQRARICRLLRDLARLIETAPLPAAPAEAGEG